MLLKYYNGHDYGYIETDLLEFVEFSTIPKTRKLFNSVIHLCENNIEIAADLLGKLIDKLSEYETLLDVMKAEHAAQRDINKLTQVIKRYRRAEDLCRREML